MVLILTCDTMDITERIFSGAQMTIISVDICPYIRKNCCRSCAKNILCISCTQEMHRNKHQRRPKIQSMWLVAERPHWQYGSADFVKPSISEINNTEVITVKLSNYLVTSVYKAPLTEIKGDEFNKYLLFIKYKISFVTGEFNCQSSIWWQKWGGCDIVGRFE